MERLKPRLYLPPAVRLDAPELGWLLNRQPWLLVLMPGLLTFGVLFVLALLLEGRLINPLDQYAGVFPGDLFLWLGMGSALMLVSHHFDYSSSTIWYESLRWKVLCVLVALGMGSLLTGAEVHAMRTNPHGAATYTTAQFWSPTHLAHTIIVPLMAYITMRVLWPALFCARTRYSRWVLVLKVLAVTGYLGWVFCAIVLDNFVLPRPNLANVHPLDGGWFGGWWPDVWRSFIPKPLFDL